ncbi:MAG: glutathione ABC transporter permease GsiC [Chloroflexi bacterium]|nr:MAG: glutathione ABC transporter permease GsiC [Chloroflexota bacterium]
MGRFILKRVVLVIPVLIGVTLLTFMMVHLVPGDPIVVMLGDRATAENVERLRREFGFDRPLYVQYLDYVWSALQGDLGSSIRTRQPVLDEVLRVFPSTLKLTAAAVLVATVVGVSAGMLAATAKHRIVDFLTMALVLVGISTPTFFSSLLLILLFSLKLDLLPVAAGSGIKPLILPSVALAAPAAAVLARVTRSSLLEELRKDYVRTAYAKGLKDRTVMTVHVLKNALIPVVTIIGLQVGGLMAGAVIVESVFARPGIGRFAVTSINARDLPAIQGIALVAALIYVTVNLLVDILYGFIDPRIKYR